MKEVKRLIFTLALLGLISVTLHSQACSGTFERSLQLHVKNLDGGTIGLIQFDGNQNLGSITVCENVPILIEINSSFPLVGQGCPPAKFHNESSYCNGECISLSPPQVMINYNGGDYSWTDEIIYPTPPSQDCYSGSVIRVNVVPTQSDTFDISWITSRIIEYVDEANCNPNNFPFQQTISYSNKVFLNVIPQIEVSLDGPSIASPGEVLYLTVDECTPYMSYGLLERCDDNYENPMTGDISWSSCGVSSGPHQIIYGLERYTHLKTFKIAYRNSLCYPEIRFSNELTIAIEENPVENACNDDEIADTEQMLQTPSSVANRRDYHDFNTEPKVICNTNDSGCSVLSVYNFMKTNIAYQAPTEIDFTGDEDDNIEYFDFGYLGYSQLPTETPVTSCEQIYLEGDNMRMLANIALFGIMGPFEYLAYRPIDRKDPIKVVVDDDCKCVTNYTLDGHILHFGKVRRCITLSNCGDVVVETKGTGFHFSGDNEIGEWFGKTNERLGKAAFERLDDRLYDAYNNQ